ncbi:MAG TPA: hypothetical protein VGQ83_19030 [Polyangia bacterium]|jgi:hypothetical protein
MLANHDVAGRRPLRRRTRIAPLALLLAAAGGCSSSTNQPPVIAGVTAAPLPATPGATVAVAVAATDPDNDKLTYAWTAPAGWTIAGAATGPAIQVTAPQTAAQTGMVTVTVSDSAGHQTTGQTLVATSGGQAPGFALLSASPNPLPPGGTALVVAVAESAAGAEVTYTWSVADAAWTIAGTGGSATLTGPAAYGASTAVTVVATDALGATATAALDVATIQHVPPHLGGIDVMPLPLAPGASAVATVTAVSELGLPLTYEWTVADAAWTVTGASPTATLEAPGRMNASTVLTVKVTDSAGGSAQRSTVVATGWNQAGPPVAVIGGVSPLSAVMNTPLELDGSGSHSQTGDLIFHRWEVLAHPAGASVRFLTADLDHVDATVPRPFFVADLPGVYDVQLMVIDAATGEVGYALTRVIVAGPATVAIVSGDGQSGTVGRDLGQPLIARALTSRGEPVPGLMLFWDVVNGAIFSGTVAPGVPYALTDLDGRSAISVRLPRFAADGSAKVTAIEMAAPAATTFGFHALADKAASINVSAAVGNVIDGVQVTVQVIDQYGNPATDNASANTASFRLTAVSSSSSAKLAPAGNPVTTLDAQLTGGVYTVKLTSPRAEQAIVSLGQGPAGLPALPFTAWVIDAFEHGELGLNQAMQQVAPGTETLPRWDVRAGAAKVHAGSRALGAELQPSEARIFGTTSLGSRARLVDTSKVTKLTFAHKVQVGATRAASAPCTLQPSLFVYRAGASTVMKRPMGGYGVRDLCTGWKTRLESFGATSGWVTQTVDLTDDAAVTANDYFGFRIYNPSDAEVGGTSASTLGNPAQPITWYVDDIQVSRLTAASDQTTFTTALFFPGPATKLQYAATAGAYVYGWVSGLQKDLQADARLVDANGNQTLESEMVFRFTWDGAAVPTGVPAGTPLAIDAHQADVKLAGGRAVLTLNDLAVETVHLGVANPHGYAGIDVTSTVNAAVPWAAVNHTGIPGARWSDPVLIGTYEVGQALRACETTRTFQGFTGWQRCAVDPSFPSTVALLWSLAPAAEQTRYFPFAGSTALPSSGACLDTATPACGMGTDCPTYAQGQVFMPPWVTSPAAGATQTTCGGKTYWSDYNITPASSAIWN